VDFGDVIAVETVVYFAKDEVIHLSWDFLHGLEQGRHYVAFSSGFLLNHAESDEPIELWSNTINLRVR